MKRTNPSKITANPSGKDVYRPYYDEEKSHASNPKG